MAKIIQEKHSSCFIFIVVLEKIGKMSQKKKKANKKQPKNNQNQKENLNLKIDIVIVIVYLSYFVKKVFLN